MRVGKRVLLQITAALALLLLGSWLVMGASRLPLAITLWLVGVAALYLGAHLLRGLRLLLLIYDGRVRFREVLRAHLFAAGVSRLIPFKLGELYRIALVDCLVANPATAIATVVIERAYDIAFLAMLIAFGLLFGLTDHPSAQAALVIAVSLLFTAALALIALPELLPLLKRYLVLRHNSERSLVLLRTVDRIDLLLAGAIARWRQRRAAVTALSVVIWTLEAAVLMVFVRGVAGGDSGLADVMIDALSALLLIGTQDGISGGSAAAALGGYLLATAVPLSLVALVIGLQSPFRTQTHPPMAVILDRLATP
jgi:hypothetical protein